MRSLLTVQQNALQNIGTVHDLLVSANNATQASVARLRPIHAIMSVLNRILETTGLSGVGLFILSSIVVGGVIYFFVRRASPALLTVLHQLGPSPA